jgi:hypothetical protein
MPLFFQMKRLLGSPEADTVAESGVYSTRKFSEIIRNERARCDRYGRCFALVMFQLDDRKKNGPGFREWIRRIRGRIRPIDAMGWIDGNRLAVLLPGTPLSGAECFVGDVRRRGPESCPAWNVFVYPSPSRACPEKKAAEAGPLDDRSLERS